MYISGFHQRLRSTENGREIRREGISRKQFHARKTRQRKNSLARLRKSATLQELDLEINKFSACCKRYVALICQGKLRLTNIANCLLRPSNGKLRQSCGMSTRFTPPTWYVRICISFHILLASRQLSTEAWNLLARKVLFHRNASTFGESLWDIASPQRSAEFNSRGSWIFSILFCGRGSSQSVH